MPSPQHQSHGTAKNRRALLHAAAECFARSGFAQATVKDIAETAGLTVPTLYKYFPSKQSILEALVEDLVSEAEGLFEVLLPRGLTFAQKVELLIAHHLRWAESRRHAFRFLLGARPTVHRHSDDETRRLILGRFEGWLREHAEPASLRCPVDQVAMVLHALEHAYFQRWVAGGAEPGLLVAEAANLTDLALHGILPGDDSP